MTYLTPDKEAYLAKLGAIAFVYKLKSAEDLMSFYGVPYSQSKKKISDSIKKTAESYVKDPKKFLKKYYSQAYSGYSYGDEYRNRNDYQQDSEYGGQYDYGGSDLGNRLFGQEQEEGKVSPEVSDLLVQLNSLLKSLSKMLYGIELTEPQSLKVTKETMKIISARIADIPISDAIDAIDRYLDKLEKGSGSAQSNVRPPSGSSESVNQESGGEKVVQPSGASEVLNINNPNEVKNIPPWARL